MSEESEELKCAICLDEWTDVAELHECTHLYCFECIVRWSDTCNQCPQCKRRFYQISSLDGVHEHKVEYGGGEDSDESGTTSEERRVYGGYRADGFIAADDEIEYSDESIDGGTMSEDDFGMDECEDGVREVRRRRRPTARQQYRRHHGVDELEHETRETITLVPLSVEMERKGRPHKRRLRRRQPGVINLVSDDEEDN